MLGRHDQLQLSRNCLPYHYPSFPILLTIRFRNLHLQQQGATADNGLQFPPSSEAAAMAVGMVDLISLLFATGRYKERQPISN